MNHPKVGRLAGELSWLIPLFAAVLVFGLWLMAKGSKGAEIATSLSLPVTIVGVAVSVLFFRLQDQGKGAETTTKSRLTRLQWRWMALAVAVVLGVGAPFFYWTVIHKPDVNMTDRVTVSDGAGLRNGGTAALQFPGSPPQRRHVALSLALTNRATVGDCVNPAGLAVTLFVDGRQRPAVTTRSGQEIRLSLHGVSRQARAVVTLSEPDPECQVDLSVAEAVLYN